jgi:hypothetical protein
MLPLNNLTKARANNSPKKEQSRSSANEERLVTYTPQSFSPSTETIIVVVMPCGREDG